MTTTHLPTTSTQRQSPVHAQSINTTSSQRSTYDSNYSSPPTTLIRQESDTTIQHEYTRTIDSEITPEQCYAYLQTIFTNSQLFSRLSDSDILLLSQVLTVLNFNKNERVLHMGEKATFCAIILSGTWYAQIAPDKQNKLVPGSFLGEMGYFEGGYRSADIYCTADAMNSAVLGVLTYDELDHLRYMGKEGSSLHTKWLFILANASIHRLRQLTNTPQYTGVQNNDATSNQHNTMKESLFLSKGAGLVSKQETLIIEKYKQIAGDSLHIEISRLKRKLAIADKNQRDNIYTMENLQRKYGGLQDECATQAHELHTLHDKLDHITSISTGQATLIDTWKSYKQQSDDKYCKQIDTLSNELSTLQKQYADAQSQLDVLLRHNNDNHVSLTKSNSLLTYQNQQLQAQLNQLNTQYHELNNAHSILVTNNAQLQSDYQSKCNEFDYTKFRLIESNDKYNDQLHTINSLEYKIRLLEIEVNDDAGPVISMSDVVEALAPTKIDSQPIQSNARRKHNKHNITQIRDQLRYKKLLWLVKWLACKYYTTCYKYRKSLSAIYSNVCVMSHSVHQQLNLAEPELPQPNEINQWTVTQYIDELESVLFGIQQPLSEFNTYSIQLNHNIEHFFQQNIQLKQTVQSQNDQITALQQSLDNTNTQLQQQQQLNIRKLPRLAVNRGSVTDSTRTAQRPATQQNLSTHNKQQTNLQSKLSNSSSNTSSVQQRPHTSVSQQAPAKQITDSDINSLIISLGRTIQLQSKPNNQQFTDTTKLIAQQLPAMNSIDKLYYINHLEAQTNDGYNTISPYHQVRPNSRTGVRLQHAQAMLHNHMQQSDMPP